jgi:hypothetical protein
MVITLSAVARVEFLSAPRDSACRGPERLRPRFASVVEGSGESEWALIGALADGVTARPRRPQRNILI